VDTYRRNAARSVACGVVYPPPNATTQPFVIFTVVVVAVVNFLILVCVAALSVFKEGSVASSRVHS
jgi:hypothetical protein